MLRRQLGRRGVYGYPYQNVTGMVEVAGAKERIDLLQGFAKGSRVGLLADDTLSSKKDIENYKNKLGIDLAPVYVSSFADWKQQYSDAQRQFDILIIVGISDFDQDVALKILGGKSPADIPVSRNKGGQVVIDLKMAEAAGIEIPYSLIETATTVMQQLPANPPASVVFPVCHWQGSSFLLSCVPNWTPM